VAGDPTLALTEKGKPKLVGKEGKPSEANHGNVTPSLKNEKGAPHHGGITCAYALQTAVLSLPALRRLHFPVKGATTADTDLAARTVLAALGLCGAVLAVEQGLDLRSRCLLVPDADQPAGWELVRGDGTVESLAITAADACRVLSEAVAAATAKGLPWKKDGITLIPSEGLVALVKKSRDLALAGGEAE
jgi:CRISPR-associated protein Csb1